ncbi:MAG: lysylphosphatidylglycerol synthase transmembrane domain-containing protein [Melioribacteraceae bacterium]
MKLKSQLKLIIKIFISGVLLYFIVKDVNFDEIFASFKTSNKLLLILAFSLHAVGLTISAIRWKVLLTAQGVQSKIGFLIKSYMVATFFNHFMPSTVGGDSVRAYDSWRLGENKAKAFAVVVVDRFMGLLTLLVFVIIATFFTEKITSQIPNLNAWLILLVIGALSIVWFILFPPLSLFEKLSDNNNSIVKKIGGLLHKLGSAFAQFSTKKEALVKAIFLSVLLQANVVFYYFLISQALNFNIDIINFFLIVPLTIFIMMIPISINGIGLRENTLFFFLSFYGVAKSQAITFAWLEYGMLLILGIIGGIVYALRK